MSTYKASILNYIFNSINSIVVIVNGIVMVPIYFHYMSVSTYGAWLATGNVVAMLGLLESGFASVITQKLSVAIAQNNVRKVQVLSGSNLATAIGLSLTILMLGLSISPFISGWVNAEISASNDIFWAYVVALISSCIGLMNSLLGAFPQVWQDTKAVGLINTIVNLVSIAALVFFLLFGFGVVSIALSYLSRALLNFIFQGSWIIKNWKKIGFAKPLFRFKETIQLTRDCFYPFMSKLSGLLMDNTQSFILAHFLNPTFAAVYDLTAKVCYVGCSFVSMTNGSFFALFSLTLASKDKEKINSVFSNTTKFFVLSLSLVALNSICFTEPICRYWVGLDKFGGTLLLVTIVISKVFFQLKSYCNNILYTGGLINRSAKLDILCMFVYIVLLIAIIKPTQVLAVPIATLVSSSLFIVWYVRMMKDDLNLDINLMIKELVKAFALIIPFVIFHFAISVDYENVATYIVYFILISICFFSMLYFINKVFVHQIISKLHRK